MQLRVPFGLRGQVFLVSLILLAIPWVGYRYIWQVEKFLREGQAHVLTGTAQAVATALHDRPQLFEPVSSGHRDKQGAALLYVRTLAKPIMLDGKLTDWRAQEVKQVLYRDETNPAFSFTQQAGKFDQFLYLAFDVNDAGVEFLNDKVGLLDQTDHLQIVLGQANGDALRFMLALAKAPQVRVFRVTGSSEETENLLADPRIEAAWRGTKTGYQIEVKIPLELLQGKLRFSVINITNSTELQSLERLGTGDGMLSVVIPGMEIDAILRGVSRSTARIWVVDALGRVLARTGSLQNTVSHAPGPANDDPWYKRWAKELHSATLRQIYSSLLASPDKAFVDDLANATKLEGSEIESAFNGAGAIRWRMTPDKGAIVLSAAQPIWVGDRVAGAVVVEETTNEILALRNQALERLFNVTIAVLLLGSLTLLLFATRLSKRIRALRDQAEQALDSKGRIRSLVAGSNAKDEIGDLSRSFSGLLHHLADYNRYLELMAGRVSHEFRTPIAVVRSSLDNLRQHALPIEASIYVNRAQEGIERLSIILNRMSEATKLEQSLQQVEREKFDLAAVIRGCVEGYRGIHSQLNFVLQLPEEPISMRGAPDLIAQMLDKLVANAIDFHRAGSAIDLTLQANLATAEIIISNEGAGLPREMQERLFDSMVSVRPQQGGNEAHLGLGLYIVRLIAEFHLGTARLENRSDGNGVNARVILSLLEPTNIHP
ncbi:MAG: proteobacterial dedicated sortase system histidine kinase [Burkholderiales bacterium]